MITKRKRLAVYKRAHKAYLENTNPLFEEAMSYGFCYYLFVMEKKDYNVATPLHEQFPELQEARNLDAYDPNYILYWYSPMDRKSRLSNLARTIKSME